MDFYGFGARLEKLLERMNWLFVGREKRTIKLKKKVRGLEGRIKELEGKDRFKSLNNMY